MVSFETDSSSFVGSGKEFVEFCRNNKALSIAKGGALVFRWISGSVKRRVLVTFVSLVLILSLLIIGLTGYLSSSLVENLVEENFFALINSRAQVVSLWRHERMQELIQLANTPLLETGDWELIEPFLQRQIQKAPNYYLLFFMAYPNGEYHTTLQRFAGHVGDRSYFTPAMSGQTVISEPLFSRSTGEKIQIVATPVWNEDNTEIIGVLGLSLSLEDVFMGMGDLDLGYPGGELFVIDRSGHFLFHPDPELIVTSSMQDLYPAWNTLEKEQTGSYTYFKDELEFRGFYVNSPDNDWSVIAEVPTSYYKEPIKRLISYLFLVGLVCMISVFLVGLWFSKSVTDPIMELKEIFRRGSEGDLTIRAKVGIDELGETGASFNKMMETIGTMTYYDPLTNLPNRPSFLDHLGKSLEQDPVVILALVSVRGLSELKTLLGSEVTDQVLIQVSELLKNIGEEKLVVARVADEEFGMIISSNTRHVLEVVDRLDEVLNKPLEVLGHNLQLRLFGGISISEPQKVSDPEHFYQQARAALYEAERNLTEHLKLYNPTTHHQIVDRLRFQTEIRTAFDLEQFVVFYQPVIDLRSKTIVGKEALIRWQHPVRGLLAPGEFLDSIERGGFIEDVGKYMLEKVCNQHTIWSESGLDLGWVAVNISAKHFRSPHFPAQVQSMLACYEKLDGILRLELTEEAMLSPTPQVLYNFRELQDMGVALAIDDFGTAYSSLEYLVRYPVETIKIDRTFIDLLDQNDRSEALVRAIVALGHNLSMTVVAEGVERPEQVVLLSEMGCNEAQGYYFSAPVPYEDYPKTVTNLMELLGGNTVLETQGKNT